MSAQDKEYQNGTTVGGMGVGSGWGLASQALGFADVKFEMPRRHLGGTVR